jgi:hypothetical protein
MEFGLQDRQQALMPGETQPDGSLRFACAVTVKYSGEEDPPDFSGAFVHGARGARFLYLSLRRQEEGRWERRLKIPLKGISAEQITALEHSANGVLTARVSGEGSGTVALLDGGWKLLTSG